MKKEIIKIDSKTKAYKINVDLNWSELMILNMAISSMQHDFEIQQLALKLNKKLKKLNVAINKGL